MGNKRVLAGEAEERTWGTRAGRDGGGGGRRTLTLNLLYTIQQCAPFRSAPVSVFYLCPCSSLLPAKQELRDESSMVFVKGDANYRRLIGDRLWPTDTPFSDVAGYFPARLCALRTLKAELG